MRALVVLAAIVFKYWFVYRMMTPRQHMMLIIACWLFVAVMMSIWMKRNEKPEPKNIGEPFCNYPTPPHIDFPDCQFKLRDVRTGASSQLLADRFVSIAESGLQPLFNRFNTLSFVIEGRPSLMA